MHEQFLDWLQTTHIFSSMEHPYSYFIMLKHAIFLKKIVHYITLWLLKNMFLPLFIPSYGQDCRMLNLEGDLSP